MIYYKVYEPHKSGVPHAHIMAYLPPKFILPIKKAFYKHFNNYGSKQIQFKYTWYGTKGAISYIMKYILKTFTNEDEELTYEAIYYMKYRIIRFSTSRTLVPIYIYRKTRYRFAELDEDDLLLIDSLYFKKLLRPLFNKTVIEFSYFTDEGEYIEEIIYNKRFYEGVSNKQLIGVLIFGDKKSIIITKLDKFYNNSILNKLSI